MSVRLERRAALAILTLDAGDRGNPIDEKMVAEFVTAAAAVQADATFRALLIRAEGKHFSIGGDVSDFASRLDELPDYLANLVAHFHRGVADIASLEIPVITAVQGSAAGAGLSLVCLGDIVLGSESAGFVLAYTALGLTPDAGASWTLPRLVGTRMALDLMLTNRRLDAREALAAGLISRVVPDEVLQEQAEKQASRLAAGPTSALIAAKRLLRAAADSTLVPHLELERASLARLAGTAQGREGITAFIEGRPPVFSP
jgi:2-(1,2-epoxy-1,2-dihydrophenyl)acetyl-CoA isomerase